jgi:phage FluMu gp28-like protein
LEKAAFQAQEDYLSNCIERLHPRRLCIDATGIGMQLAEDLSQNFSCVEGVTFTNSLKETLSVTCRRLFEKRQIRIPNDRELINDIHRIKKIVTAAGNIRYDAERNASGHADRYWALALAIHASSRKASPAIEMGRDPEKQFFRRDPKNFRFLGKKRR